MEQLHWPLHILSRAIHFKNLSGASAHVGLSQPQLSRLVSQIEKELDVVLLDRTARRKSGWTPAAFKLAEVYLQSSRKLQAAIHEVVETQVPAEIHIGTLEGLSPIAIELTKLLFKDPRLHLIEVNIFDQNELEEKFLNGDIDLCFSSRAPGRQKLKHEIELGYQTFEEFEGAGNGAEFFVQSPYERGRRKQKEMPHQKYFVSNSLALRRLWLTEFGGHGSLPGGVRRAKGKDLSPVLLFANDVFNEHLWHIVSDAVAKLKVE